MAPPCRLASKEGARQAMGGAHFWTIGAPRHSPAQSVRGAADQPEWKGMRLPEEKAFLRAGSCALHREGAHMFWAGQSDERRICLLGLEGSLSSSDLVNLTERLRGLAAQGVWRVVVDLRRVSHWDFRALKCLAEAVEYRSSLGGVTAFVSPSRYLRDIATAAGVLEHFDFYDDVQLGAVAEAVPRPREEPKEIPMRRVSGQRP